MAKHLVQVVTGLVLLNSLQALVAQVPVALLVLLVVVDGITTASPRLSTAMDMVTQDPVAAAAVVLQHAVAVMDNGVMESTLLARPTHVSSVSFSVLQMTQPSNKLVSTSRNTTISPSRLPVPTFLSPFSGSPTLLLTII